MIYHNPFNLLKYFCCSPLDRQTALMDPYLHRVLDRDSHFQVIRNMVLLLMHRFYHLILDRIHQRLRRMVLHLHHQVEVEEEVVDTWWVEDILLGTHLTILDQMWGVNTKEPLEIETYHLHLLHWQLLCLLRLQLHPPNEEQEEVNIDIRSIAIL